MSIIQSLQKERSLFDNIKSIQGIEKTEYKLSVVVIPGKGLKIKLNYDGKYYNKEDIDKISKHLKQLVSNNIST